ncbi:MAG TPA: hypothetical protein VK536_00590 [Candidatus Limnocylindrales bacterium]|nr:hypothetical protein [Candidatus Limnocylindrales bacterium]
MKKLSVESEFGWIKVNGEKYEKDIVIHSDGSISKREKKKSKGLKAQYGHTPLSELELDFLSGEKFEALYVGTGHEGALPVTPKAFEILKRHDAKILPTPEVVEKIEAEQRPFVAMIHVTC